MTAGGTPQEAKTAPPAHSDAAALAVSRFSSSQAEQLRRATDTLHLIFGPAVRGIWLHGSAATSGLRAESDIDLLVVLDRPMSESERRTLVSRLLDLSPRQSGLADDPRRLEVMVFVEAALDSCVRPVEAEFLYGEWLRDAYETGTLPMHHRNADNTLILAQAERTAVALIGNGAPVQLPAIAVEDIRNALKDALPPLFEGLRGDERNVILTLARMWFTADTGTFVSKDQAAIWAEARMPEGERLVLEQARNAYLGKTRDEWSNRQEAALRTAEYLRRRTVECLERGSTADGPSR